MTKSQLYRVLPGLRKMLADVDLSTGQLRVAELLLCGLNADEISERLGLSRHTVRVHISAIYPLCGVTSHAKFITKFMIAPALRGMREIERGAA